MGSGLPGRWAFRREMVALIPEKSLADCASLRDL